MAFSPERNGFCETPESTPIPKDFDPSLWDSLHGITFQLTHVIWFQVRNEVLEALRIVRDISGHPDVDEDDSALAAFLFAFSEILVSEAEGTEKRKGLLLQRLSADAFFRIYQNGALEPHSFWSKLLEASAGYRTAATKRGKDRKFVSIVEHFLNGYDLVEHDISDLADLVDGLCKVIAPFLREVRHILKEGKQSLFEQERSDAELSVPDSLVEELNALEFDQLISNVIVSDIRPSDEEDEE